MEVFVDSFFFKRCLFCLSKPERASLCFELQFIRGFNCYSVPPSLQLNFKASFHCHKGLFASVRRKLSVDDLPGPHSNLNGFSLAKKFILDGLKLLPFQQKKTDLDLGKILLKAQLRNVKNFGPIFMTKYTGLRTVVNVKISNPLDAAAVFRAEGRSPIRPESPAMNHYRKKTDKLPGLLFGNGRNWSKYRRWDQSVWKNTYQHLMRLSLTLWRGWTNVKESMAWTTRYPS